MELSPAPIAKKIADRLGGGSDSDLSIYIIENIEVIEAKSVTDLEEDKKKQSDDSSGTTITEERRQE
jgi:hypothetical protein